MNAPATAHEPPKKQRTPPRKRPGQGRGPHTVNGFMLDIRTGSALCGWSEKQSRAMIGRGLMPHRRLGRRILFVRAELETWLQNLGGVTLEEATANQRTRTDT
jgi:hypothetical protein